MDYKEVITISDGEKELDLVFKVSNSVEYTEKEKEEILGIIKEEIMNAIKKHDLNSKNIEIIEEYMIEEV